MEQALSVRFYYGFIVVAVRRDLGEVLTGKQSKRQVCVANNVLPCKL